MITREEANVYRQRLFALMSRLDCDRTQLKDEALRATGGEASGGLSDVPVHPADLGSNSFEEVVTLGLLENQDEIIDEINAALVRIDQAVFGRCEACQQMIPKGRLQALPYARYCVACAREVEG